MKDVSIIIVYRKSLQDKEDNLNFIVEYYKTNFSNSEIIVVEQDNDIKYNNTKNTNHIFCYNNGLFNRSWGFNVGLNNCSNQKIIFADIDCYMNINEMVESIQLLNYYDVVKPYNRFCMLNYNSSILVKNNKHVDYNFENIVPTNYGAGILVGNKSSILSIGSWPEEFEGWGGEDDAMSIKIKYKLNCVELNYNLFHLHHERNKMVSSNGHVAYDFNRRQALEIIPRMTEEQLNKYIEEGKQKNVGNINKYKN